MYMWQLYPGQGSRGLCVNQESCEPLRKAITSQAWTPIFLPTPGHSRLLSQWVTRQFGPPACAWSLEELWWIQVCILNPGVWCPHFLVAPSMSSKPWPVFPLPRYRPPGEATVLTPALNSISEMLLQGVLSSKSWPLREKSEILLWEAIKAAAWLRGMNEGSGATGTTSNPDSTSEVAMWPWAGHFASVPQFLLGVKKPAPWVVIAIDCVSFLYTARRH